MLVSSPFLKISIKYAIIMQQNVVLKSQSFLLRHPYGRLKTWNPQQVMILNFTENHQENVIFLMLQGKCQDVRTSTMCTKPQQISQYLFSNPGQ